jgi:hypothetical protein
VALHGSGMRDGKLFVVDLAANGLPSLSTGNGQIDIVYEDVSKQTTFNADWQSQKLSQAEYEKRLQVTDERYARMLIALIAELRTGQERRSGISGSQPAAQRRMSGHDMELVVAGGAADGR